MGPYYKMVYNKTVLPYHKGQIDHQNQTLLPHHKGQIDHQNQINTKLYGNHNSSRQN
jgi:hypothetical protein